MCNVHICGVTLATVWYTTSIKWVRAYSRVVARRARRGGRGRGREVRGGGGGRGGRARGARGAAMEGRGAGRAPAPPPAQHKATAAGRTTASLQPRYCRPMAALLPPYCRPTRPRAARPCDRYQHYNRHYSLPNVCNN